MTSQCSIDLLESALAGTLSPDDEQTLGAHLETCAACTAELERLAGGPTWSQHAAALLKSDDLDDMLPVRDEWWDVDFSVEHLEPADEPGALGRLGNYDILEIIGRGGMGVVLKGFDRELKRCVALKVLAPHLAHSSLAKKRFTREAQAAAAIVHPNVLAIHQVQSAGRLPFLVMPLVAGESLAQRLASRGTLELKEILRIGMQAAAGLAAAHEQGLVHRDVKPANILLEKGVERAVLTDFGLARAADDVSITRLGIIAGTPQYMSPEQARGEPLDGRSDLFSLGCVLYEMATGISPFRADSMVATMRRLVDEAPQALASLNPELPPWFCAIVHRLLEKDRERRFGSAKEVSELLEGCLAHVQQPTGVPLPALASLGRVSDPSLPSGRVRDPSYKTAPPRAKRSLVIIGVLVMIATLGIGLASFLAFGFVDPPEIGGEWSGPDWGKVVLKLVGNAEYKGSYTDTFGKQPGEMSLSWSRLESRFVGTWREAEDRFGEISLRLVGAEIRGAYTTDAKAKINPGRPRLAEFVWTRGGASFLPIVECTIKGAIDFDLGESLDKVVDPNDTAASIAKWMETSGMDACFDAHSLLTFDMTVVAAEAADWLNATPEQLTERVRAAIQANAPPIRLRPAAKGPATYVIHTREGSLGLVQVNGFTNDERTALRIRYKLAPQKLQFTRAEKKPVADVKIAASKQAFLDGERKIAFTMNKKPWREVIDWIVDQTGLAFVSIQPIPDGAFDFNPPTQTTYSFPEVMDIINEGLQLHECYLVRSSVNVMMVSVKSLRDPNQIPRVKLEELGKYGKSEVVQVLMQLKVAVAADLVPDVKEQLGPFGSVDAIKRANQLLITDRVGSIRRVLEWVNGIEGREIQAANPVLQKRFRFLSGEAPNALAYSPDERLLAVASDPTAVTLLDAKTGVVVRTIKAVTAQEEALFRESNRPQNPRFPVVVTAFSPDSSVLAFGNFVGQVKLFDVPTGDFLRALDGHLPDSKKDDAKDGMAPLVRAHDGWVRSIVFSRDGATVATCGGPPWFLKGPGPQLAALWNVKTGAQKRDNAEGFAGLVQVLAFAPDGKTLAGLYFPAGKASKGGPKTFGQLGLAVFDAASGKNLGVVSSNIVIGDSNIDSEITAAFLPDGKRLAIRSREMTEIVYPRSNVVERRWPGFHFARMASMRPIVLSPDGKTIAYRASETAVTLWNVDTGEQMRGINLPRPPGERFDWLEYSPSGRAIAVGGVDADGKGFVEAWDVAPGFANPAGSDPESGKTPVRPAP